MKKPASTKEKILQALEEATTDPLRLEIHYLDKDQLSTVTGATGSTLNNALTDLTKAREIHRPIENGKEVTGSTASARPQRRRSSHSSWAAPYCPRHLVHGDRPPSRRAVRYPLNSHHRQYSVQ
ncbi:hypothetical protein ACIRP2_37050 [Streptomyces sp. NPDC101194]|uniref:hypothetical protein n=1 Tax=Streptomyces sp. NPDC101194 TaxID=3366127 RepID=UPI003827DF0C